jgi:hypothetical protein
MIFILNKRMVRSLLYLVFTLIITKSIFIFSPDGEFFDNETVVQSFFDFLSRIEYGQILVIIIPVFSVIFLISESIYYIFLNLKQSK